MTSNRENPFLNLEYQTSLEDLGDEYYDEVNVLGNKILSLFQLFEIMATRMNKIVIPINSIFLFWIKWVFINKRGFFYTLSQQINKFDRKS